MPESIWIEDGVVDIHSCPPSLRKHGSVRRAMGKPSPGRLLISMDSQDGSGAMRMDQPLSSFAERRFGAQMLRGRQHEGNAICVYSALFEGRLAVTNVERFRKALETGIGHGKVMGLGLLSVVPSGG